MRKEWQPLLWFSIVSTDKTQWDVILTCPELSTYLQRGDYAALCVFETHQILINVEQDLFVQNEAVIHELMHVVVDLDGSITQRTAENTIRALDRLLTRILPQLGYKLPKRPAGYSELARHAQRKYRKQNANKFAAHNVEE